MKLAVAQVNPVVGDIQGNCRKIETMARKAAEMGSDLVVFPELCVPGCPARDLLLIESFVEENVTAVSELAKKIPEIPCVVGFADKNPLPGGRPLYSAAAILEKGEIQYVSYKSSVPRRESFDQSALFEPAVGASVTKFKDRRILITLGEDLWTDEAYGRPVGFQRSVLEDVSKKKIELVINIAASPYTLGMDRKRLEILQSQAMRYKVPIVMCNQVGGNDESVYDGTSAAVSMSGQIIARAKSFEEDVIFIDLVYGAGDLHGEELDDPELLYRAMVLGIRDFVVKCGLEKVVLELSSGVESALIACLAADAVGKENVYGLVMFSDESAEEAQELGRALGIRTDVVGIRGIVESHLDAIARFFEGDAGDGTRSGLGKSVRAGILKAVARQVGTVVLTGRDTLVPGDDVRSLCPTSDIPAAMLQRIAREIINREAAVIPDSILARPPGPGLPAGKPLLPVGLRLTTDPFERAKRFPVAGKC